MEIHLGVFSVGMYGFGVALAALAGFLVLRQAGRGEKPGATTLALYVIPCALVGARLLFCVVQYEYLFLEVGPLFVLQTWNGGFLLWGALLGGAGGALLTARRANANALSVLDRLACPALAAIVLCRLAEFFTTEGRGLWLEEGSFFCRFPFAAQNEYGEWQLAVFLWEAAAAFLILLRCRRHEGKPGDRALVMLICYSACQIVFESLRMDSTPRFGFVRASQLFAGIALALCAVLRACREGNAKSAALHGLGVFLYIGTVVGVEFAIDKTQIPLPVCYGIMIAATLLLLWRVLGRKPKKAGPLTQPG